MKFPTEKRVRLGEMLLKANLISEEHLKTALEYQKNNNTRLGEAIEKLGYVKGDVMTDFIARQQGLEIINLDEVVLPEALIKKIPQSIIEKYTVLPIAKHDDVLTIALSDPTEYEAIDEIQLYTNLRIEVVLASRSALKKAIGEIFHRESLSKAKKKLIEGLETKSTSLRRKAKKDYADELNALIRVLLSKNIITPDELTKEIEEVRKKA